MKRSLLNASLIASDALQARIQELVDCLKHGRQQEIYRGLARIGFNEIAEGRLTADEFRLRLLEADRTDELASSIGTILGNPEIAAFYLAGGCGFHRAYTKAQECKGRRENTSIRAEAEPSDKVPSQTTKRCGLIVSALNTLRRRATYAKAREFDCGIAWMRFGSDAPTEQSTDMQL